MLRGFHKKRLHILLLFYLHPALAPIQGLKTTQYFFSWTKEEVILYKGRDFFPCCSWLSLGSLNEIKHFTLYSQYYTWVVI